jgi:hypothetical protein
MISSSASPSRWIPLFLSAFLLPGLGQIQMGNKKRGWFFVGAVLALNVVIFGKFMMAVFRVMERHRYPRPPMLNVGKMLMEAYHLEQTWILTSLGLLFLFWMASILDILIRPKG